jgi:hypothetical protein
VALGALPEAQPQPPATLLDAARCVPVPELQRLLWGRLDRQGKAALRQSCWAFERLARDALVTSFDASTPPGWYKLTAEQRAQARAAACRALLWAAQHYRALASLRLSIQHSTSPTALAAALRHAPRLMRLTVDGFVLVGPAGGCPELRAALGGLQLLEELSLGYNDSCDEDLAADVAAALGRLQSLQRLHLSLPEAKSAAGVLLKGVAAALPHLPRLEAVRLQWARSSAAAASALAALAQAPALCELRLHNCSLGAAEFGALAQALPSLPALRVLDFEDSMTDVSAGDLQPFVRALAACPAAPHLEQLMLTTDDDDAFDDGDAFVALCSEARLWQALRGLRVLNVTALGIASGAELLLSELSEHCPALQDLYLGKNAMSAGDAQSAFPHLPTTLAVLRCDHNDMGDAGLTALPTHLGPRLEELHLGDDGVTAVGARAFVQALVGAEHLTGLKKLDLDIEHLDNVNELELLDTLRAAPHLRSIVVVF